MPFDEKFVEYAADQTRDMGEALLKVSTEGAHKATKGFILQASDTLLIAHKALMLALLFEREEKL